MMSLVDLGKKLLEAAKMGHDEEVRMLMSNGAPFTTDWVSLGRRLRREVHVGFVGRLSHELMQCTYFLVKMFTRYKMKLHLFFLLWFSIVLGRAGKNANFPGRRLHFQQFPTMS